MTSVSAEIASGFLHCTSLDDFKPARFLVVCLGAQLPMTPR
jgi:hypothetical protein